MSAPAGRIRVGIGGWTFEPWRGVFYPFDLPQTNELEYAAGKVTAIEINGTFYRTQTPESYAKWASKTPEDFVFSIKALRYCTNRKALGDAGESIEKFLGSGLAELGDKLGPILWQFAPTKKFDPEEMAAFLALLPAKLGGLPLRHALEPRHDSFKDPAFVDLARKAGVAVVFADSDKYPALADVTADFVYARLESAKEEIETGYSPAELAQWAETAKTWAAGGSPAGLPYAHAEPAEAAPRDVFIFMINGAKVRAPAAAVALLDRV